MHLDTNHHSVFRLWYHLVLVVKYRRNVIDGQMSARLREIFEYIAPAHRVSLSEWNHDGDHAHVLFSAHPKTSLTKFINAYKSASSRLVKKEFPQVRRRLWKECFWGKGFCLVTTGGAPLEAIRKYIEGQGERC